MTQHSQAAQEAYVTGGLALGLVSLEVASIDRDKVRFDLAFEHAWRRFPSRPRFPRIARSTGPDPYYQVVDDGSSRRRYVPVAVFHDGDREHVPAIRRSDDSLAEAIEELEQWSAVPWAHWQQLAEDFIASYRD